MEYINDYVMDIYFICNTLKGGLYYGNDSSFRF